MQRYTMTIEPLTAIHIGTGEEIMPFDYTILKTKQGTRLARFNSEMLINFLAPEEKNELIKLINNDDFIRLRKFFQEKAKKILPIKNELISYISEFSDEFLEFYEKGIDQSTSYLAIQSMLREDKHVVIPGSSIKGALRTAILNSVLENKKPFMHIGNNDKKLEAFLLGFGNDEKLEPQKDPFRALRISDAHISSKGTCFVGAAQLYHVQKQKPESLNIFIEVLKGTIFDNTAPPAKAIIEIDDTLLHTQLMNSKLKITKDALIDAAKNYYSKLFDAEYNKIYRYSEDSIYAGVKYVADAIDNCASNEFVMRLGRFGQFEYKTFNKEYLDSYGRPHTAKSRTLLNWKNGYLPMGWCRCKIEEA